MHVNMNIWPFSCVEIWGYVYRSIDLCVYGYMAIFMRGNMGYVYRSIDLCA